MRKKINIILTIVTVTLFLTACTNKGNETQLNKEHITVGVSILPQKAFVEAVGGERVDVVTMIPPGNSPTNYQPSAKQMQMLSEAQVYFGIDVPAEVAYIKPRLPELNKEMKIVDLFDLVGDQYQVRTFEDEDEEEDHDEGEEEEDEHGHEGNDPHIWMSPKRVEAMIDAIVKSLSEIKPEYKSEFEQRANSYKAELQSLDQYIKEAFQDIKEPTFMMYHPALGYYADDYGLQMIAIEAKGKKATAQEMANVIEKAKQANIKIIFYQSEFSDQQAKIVARDIGGQVEKVNIMSEDYVDNIKLITNQIKDSIQ